MNKRTSRPPTPAVATCPCGAPRDYADCCGRYHAGEQHLAAPTAEVLMRSRYTAYVLRLEAYLLATWHPSTRPAALDIANDESRWLGLDIRRCVNNFQKNGGGAAAGPPQGGGTPSGGASAASRGSSPPAPDEVEFIARHKLGGRALRLHETSRFVREGDRWFYVDGDQHEKRRGE